MSDSFATPWTVAHQTPLSMGFPRQEYWSELAFPSPGDLPNQGSNSNLLHGQADSLPLLILCHQQRGFICKHRVLRKGCGWWKVWFSFCTCTPEWQFGHLQSSKTARLHLEQSWITSLRLVLSAHADDAWEHWNGWYKYMVGIWARDYGY